MGWDLLHINGSLCISHPVNGTVIAEVTAVLTLSDGLLWASATDLTKGTVGV